MLGGPLQGHKDWVNHVAFSPEGTRLASANSDGTIILWDVEQHTMLGALLQGHENSVNHVAFSPDGKRLASASADGTVMLWDVDEQSWLKSVCYLAGRNLTQEEWRRYASEEMPYQKLCPEYAEE